MSKTGMCFMNELADRIAKEGFAIVRNVLSPVEIQRLGASIEAARSTDNPAAVANSSGVFGLRNLIDAFLTRATFFDKTPGANWGVFWHQDRSIAVKERMEVPGYESWTKKAGVHCVQPPVEIMAGIRAIRIHLDDCRADQGALRVLPGTHRLEHLSTNDVQEQQTSRQDVVCEVAAGDAVIMCPLLLHASSPMESGERRRVIHLEFADFDLPSQLEWFHSNPLRKLA
jgi:ectoine hydroxylase-related dioxygenase (phytanoyl-CoA dioxygenase family)